MAVPIVNIMEPADWQDREMERLEAENARLRSCLSDADENARLIMGENAELREELSDVPKCESCEAMLDCDECLRADASQKERKRLDYENAKLREERDMYRDLVGMMDHPDLNVQLQAENAKLRELVRDVVLLAGVNGCDVTKMQLCVHGGDWRTVWERMKSLGVEP